jgi:hypothetical protein
MKQAVSERPQGTMSSQGQISDKRYVPAILICLFLGADRSRHYHLRQIHRQAGTPHQVRGLIDPHIDCTKQRHRFSGSMPLFYFYLIAT